MDVIARGDSFGAEVRGVDLRQVLDREGVRALLRVVDDYTVVLFPEQHLDDDQHLALARHFGEPMVHPFERAMGRTNPIHGIVDKPDSIPDRAGWHTDDSYLVCPPAYGLLRCEVAPTSGGATTWADMAAAYDRLSKGMQSILGGLAAHHGTDGGLLVYLRDHLPSDVLDRVLVEVGDGATHPIVRTQPRTGRKALYFESNFIRAIEGLNPEETGFVLSFLESRPRDESLHFSHAWTAGDLVIWDQRTTQHIGAADHQGQLRVMRRCTVEGERPV